MRCTRWDQVDAFLHKKLRADGRLSMKVPFVAEPGAPVTLAIELPNQIVVALDGVVGAPAQRDRPDAAVVVLAGAKAAIERLSAMVADARVGGGDGDLSATLAAREAELRRLRQQAAHEVLGCSRGPTLEELRAAWRQRVRREHPDAVARFRSAALRLTAEETMIHVTRAYERLRTTVCADHRAVIAGTSVRTIGALAIESHAGDGFDVVPLTPPVDDSVEAIPTRGATTPPPIRGATMPPSPRGATTPPPIRGATMPPPLASSIDVTGLSLPAPPTPLALELDLPPPPRTGATLPPPVRPAAAPTAAPTATIEQSLRQARSGPGDRFVRAIRERLADGDHAGASQIATAASQVYPKDRRLAALVEIARAQAACAAGDRDLAVRAVQAALAADADADEAHRLLGSLELGVPVTVALISEAYR
ncbi:MAG: hypothetical protein JNK64_11155 [Myxococcales bacterium]|nr:hypothetical protein [Myxococcales bacterium]